MIKIQPFIVFVLFTTNILSQSFYVANLNGKKGVINQTGKEVIDFKYDGISKVGNIFYVKIDNKFGVIDTTNTFLVPLAYDEITFDYQNEKQDIFPVKKNSTLSYWNVKKGEMKNLICDSASLFLGTTAMIFRNHKYFLIDLNGKITKNLTKRDASYKFNNAPDDYASIDVEMGVSSGNCTKENGLYGYKKSDKWIIKPEFESLEKTEQDYWIAKKDGKYGILDLEGNILLDFQYDILRMCHNYNVMLYKSRKIGLYNVKYRTLINPQYDKIEVY